MSMLVNAEKKDSLWPADSPAPHDLDRALAEAAEEMDFDWPEFLPMERIKAGITEIALGFQAHIRTGHIRRINRK